MDVQLLPPAHEKAYEEWVSSSPHGSLWQSLAWRAYQQALGRDARIYVAMEGDVIAGSALVTIDRTTGGLSTWEIARGPLGLQAETVFEHILQQAKREQCMSVHVSPAEELMFLRDISTPSQRHVFPKATRMVDLTMSDEEILGQMHSKGRYNTRVAKRKGVVVEQSKDVETFIRLQRETAERDGFAGPPAHRLRTFISKLEGSFLLLAYADRNPIAGLIGVTWEQAGIYYYGASDYQHRALMAPYLLQWEAMQFCRRSGCTQYDLLGIAPPNAPADHPWQGISGFKEKFGGNVITYPPEREIALKPMTKKLLEWKRKVW